MMRYRDRWQLEDDGKLQWCSDGLDAFDLLFPGVIEPPALTPSEFTEVFLEYLGYFTEGGEIDGPLNPEDRATVTDTLARWRTQMDEIERAIERCPTKPT